MTSKRVLSFDDSAHEMELYDYPVTGRILSLSWHSSSDFIVTGSSDAIRVWNVETGHAVNRMTPGRVERLKVNNVQYHYFLLSYFYFVFRKLLYGA